MIQSPRALFQKGFQPEMKQLALLLSEGWFQKAVAFTMSQLSHENTERAKLEGANLFLTKLDELAVEIVPEPPSLPDKSDPENIPE